MRIKNRKLHFVFEDKELNREDVLESFVKKIKGKNVTIFGDSLQRIFHQLMAEVLGFNKKVSIQRKTVRDKDGNKYIQMWYHSRHDHNADLHLKHFGFYSYEKHCGNIKK